MNKPKLSDFNLSSIKMNSNGGMEVNWSYIFGIKDKAFEDKPSIKRTLPIHKDLLDLLKKQKDVILKVEEINYKKFPELLKKLGMENKEKELNQVADGMTNEAMMKLEPTGIVLSGKDEKRSVQITYKKITGNKQIAGRATTLISLKGKVYGIEDELEKDIDKIVNETYLYLYENKHNDDDQLVFSFFKDQLEEIDEVETNKETDENTGKEEDKKPDKKGQKKKAV